MAVGVVLQSLHLGKLFLSYYYLRTESLYRWSSPTPYFAGRTVNIRLSEWGSKYGRLRVGGPLRNVSWCTAYLST